MGYSPPILPLEHDWRFEIHTEPGPLQIEMGDMAHMFDANGRKALASGGHVPPAAFINQFMREVSSYPFAYGGAIPHQVYQMTNGGERCGEYMTDVVERRRG